MKLKLRYKGGKGSGNFGHAGIPGHWGGSASGTGGGKGESSSKPSKVEQATNARESYIGDQPHRQWMRDVGETPNKVPSGFARQSDGSYTQSDGKRKVRVKKLDKDRFNVSTDSKDTIDYETWKDAFGGANEYLDTGNLG